MARRNWIGRSWDSIWSLIWREEGDPKDSVIFEESVRLGEAPSSGSAPRGGGGKRDPKMSLIKKIGLALSQSGGGGRDFEPPEWDFNEITNAYNTEGYIRQAVDKYIEMMFKADWGWVGKNPNAVEYVTMRFKLMAEATEIPTDQLFIEIAEDLVKYCNVVVAKKREQEAAVFQGMNVMGVGENAPVAGYFPLNLSTMQVKRDKFGVVKQWQQEAEGQDKPVKFKADDIVHMYYKREKGRAFGTPWLIPALDDIRALRQMEESVLRLVYRNLHPLWHIQVGDTQEGMTGEDEEVDAVRAEIENMDVEGGLVTTERVKVNSIASNQIIDATNYLKHFEQRAFTVMGVSELMMGRGNTANRSTGDNLSGEFKDRIKALQKVMTTFVNEKMVKEILMEGGFDPVLNPDDEVRFTFNEIDKDSQIKAENQAVFLYEHNAITEDEMRELIGRDPVEDGEQRAKMHLQVVTIGTAEAQAALAPAPASGGTASGQDKKRATDNKTKPANQHGVKSSPKKATNHLDQRYFKEMSHEYTVLNEAINALIERHYDQQDGRHLKTIRGAFKYAEEKMIERTAEHFNTDITDELRIPIQRLTASLESRVLTTIASMETKDGLLEAKEVAQATFDVFTDTLHIIMTRAFEISENTEEVQTGVSE